MKNKFTFSVIMFVFMMILGSCAGNTSAPETDKPVSEKTSDNAIKYYTQCMMEYPDRSIEEIVKGSALVVRAKLLELLPSESKDNLVVSHHIFEASEVYSGDKKVGDKIEVEILGGVIGDTKYSVQNPDIAIGDEVLMILSYPRDAEDNISSTDYYDFYPLRGIYYKSDEARVNSDGDVFKSRDGETFTPAEFKAEIERINNEVIE